MRRLIRNKIFFSLANDSFEDKRMPYFLFLSKLLNITAGEFIKLHFNTQYDINLCTKVTVIIRQSRSSLYRYVHQPYAGTIIPAKLRMTVAIIRPFFSGVDLT